MGTMYYGDARVPVNIDDRSLAHVKIVILTRLRRGESFAFSWHRPANEGGGRGTFWIHPAIALAFEFEGGREATINRAWIDAMILTSMSLTGLRVVPEPQGSAAAPPLLA